MEKIARKIKKPNKVLLGVAKLFYGNPMSCFCWKLKTENKIGKLKPPYLILANHSSFEDIVIGGTACYPITPNYVASYNLLIGHEKLMRSLGAVPKKQFVKDFSLIRDIRSMLRNGHVVTILPEGKISVDGRCSRLRKSTAKLIKLMKVPVVVMKINGSYLNRPKWAKRRIGCPVEVKLYPLFTAQETMEKSVEEIFDVMCKNLDYNAYLWQRENKVKTGKNRCENLHTVLYRCPHCGTEFQMHSEQNRLHCKACGKTWEMDEFGVIRATDGKTEFDSVPAWYDMERLAVRAELLQKTYRYESPAEILELPDFQGYRFVGRGVIRYTTEGFFYCGSWKSAEVELHSPVRSNDTLAFDMEKSFDFIYENDAYRVKPQHVAELVKLNLAVEENYKIHFENVDESGLFDEA